MTDAERPNKIGALSKAADVIEGVKELNRPTVSELSDHLDMPMSTTSVYLNSLRDEEYLSKEGDAFQLGLQFINLGESAKNRHIAYKDIRQKVDELAVDSGERAIFIVEEHGYGYYVHSATGEKGVKIGGRVGQRRTAFHASAAGKILLANMPDERIEAFLDRRGLEARTPNTITDIDELWAEIDQVRSDGVAFNAGELLDGLNAVAVPISDSTGTVLGAVSISGPSERIKGEYFESALPARLKEAANELQLNMNEY